MTRGGVCLDNEQKSQIGRSNVVWDDANAASGFREPPLCSMI